MAAWLSTDLVDFRGELAVAQGWFSRARSLLDGSDPSAELGWRYVHQAEKHLLYGGDIAKARSLGEQANRLGRECGDVDLEMMGLAMVGLAAVMTGELDEGTRRLSEGLQDWSERVGLEGSTGRAGRTTRGADLARRVVRRRVRAGVGRRASH